MISGGCSGHEASWFFCQSAIVGISFSCIFSFFSFGRVCAASAPAPIVGCSVGCFVYKAGGNPFSAIGKGLPEEILKDLTQRKEVSSVVADVHINLLSIIENGKDK